MVVAFSELNSEALKANAALHRGLGTGIRFEDLAAPEGACTIIDPVVLGVEPEWRNRVIVDSRLTLEECFQGVSPLCSDEILGAQQMLNVHYWGSDALLHRGQLVIHRELANEIEDLFRFLLQEKIQINSVIPMSAEQFRGTQGEWSDDKSMTQNNSSAFNYRPIASPSGTPQRLSLHALGLAIDFNPVNNPCLKDPIYHKTNDGTECAAGYRTKEPANGNYDITSPEAFHNRHPLVNYLATRGYLWGGTWGDPKDLHHFQKVIERFGERIGELRSAGFPAANLIKSIFAQDPIAAEFACEILEKRENKCKGFQFKSAIDPQLLKEFKIDKAQTKDEVQMNLFSLHIDENGSFIFSLQKEASPLRIEARVSFDSSGEFVKGTVSQFSPHDTTSDWKPDSCEVIESPTLALSIVREFFYAQAFASRSKPE
jgi:peptidoglycan LD-endopeptidase CwlK